MSHLKIRMLSGWVTATRHSPRILAHAPSSFSWAAISNSQLPCVSPARGRRAELLTVLPPWAWLYQNVTPVMWHSSVLQFVQFVSYPRSSNVSLEWLAHCFMLWKVPVLISAWRPAVLPDSGFSSYSSVPPGSFLV